MRGQLSVNKNQSSPVTRKIEVGKFYLIFDGSKTGHPGYIVWKDDEKNCYLVIRTESDKKNNVSKRKLQRQHLIDLKHPTDSNVIKSYIRTKPLMCKRKDIGKKELVGMAIHPEDQHIVDEVAKKSPQHTKSFRNKKTTDEPTRG